MTDGQSARMERILDATKKLIGDVGIDKLTMRDIARISQVAERTLYNRFGTKDALVAVAVMSYFEKSIRLSPAHRPATASLDRVFQGIDIVTKEVLGAQSFTHGLMSAYFHVDGSTAMPHALVEVINDYWLPILDGMRHEKSLRPWVSVPLLGNELTGTMLRVVLKFAQRAFPGKELGTRLRFSLLSILLGASRGAQAKRIEAFLAELSPRLAVAK